MKTVLIIDTDLGFVFWLGQALLEGGYNALPAKGVPEAKALLSELEAETDLLIVNPCLAGAADLIDALRASNVELKVLALRGEQDLSAAKIPCPDASIRKPLRPDRIASSLWLRTVEQLLARKRTA